MHVLRHLANVYVRITLLWASVSAYTSMLCIAEAAGGASAKCHTQQTFSKHI